MKRRFFYLLIFTILSISLISSYFYLRIPVYFIKRVPVTQLENNKKIHPLDQTILKNRNYFNAEHPELFNILNRPKKIVLTQEIHVDQCEVKQENFYDFIDWAKENPQKVKVMEQHPKNHQFHSNSDQHLIFGKNNVPANGINFYDAAAYCLSTGGRLPNDDEWNMIATGKSNRIYPFGNDFIYSPWDRFNPMLNSAKKCPVNDDITQTGVSALASGVSEWTLGDYPHGHPSISGGNGINKPYEIYALATTRVPKPALTRSFHTGFRCIYDQKITQTPWKTKIISKQIPSGNYQVGLNTNAISPILLSQIDPNNPDAINHVFEVIKNQSTAFFMSQFEITVAQYKHFLFDPFVKLKFYANQKEPNGIDYIPLDWHNQKKFPDRPVVGLSWWSAYAFAKWAQAELPSEEEWNQAVYGINQTQFPWGNKNELFVSKTREQGQGFPDNVGTNKKDMTENQIFDLNGNVAEWTKSIHLQNQNFKMIVKGFSFDRPMFGLQSLVKYNNIISPHFRSNSIGLRLIFKE